MCVYYVYILPNRCTFTRFTASWNFFSVLESWRLRSAGSTCPLRFSTQHPSSDHSHLSLAGSHILWMNLNSGMSWCWSMISSSLLFRSLWGKLHCWSLPFSWRFRKPFKGIALPFRYTLPWSEFVESLEIKCRERTLLFLLTPKSFT